MFFRNLVLSQGSVTAQRLAVASSPAPTSMHIHTHPPTQNPQRVEESGGMGPPYWTKMGNLNEDSSILAKGAPGGHSSQMAESRPAVPPFTPSERGEPQDCIFLLQDPKDFSQSSASRRTGTDSSPSRGLGSAPPESITCSWQGPDGADSSQSSLRNATSRVGGRQTNVVILSPPTHAGITTQVSRGGQSQP